MLLGSTLFLLMKYDVYFSGHLNDFTDEYLSWCKEEKEVEVLNKKYVNALNLEVFQVLPI